MKGSGMSRENLSMLFRIDTYYSTSGHIRRIRNGPGSDHLQGIRGKEQRPHPCHQQRGAGDCRQLYADEERLGATRGLGLETSSQFIIRCSMFGVFYSISSSLTGFLLISHLNHLSFSTNRSSLTGYLKLRFEQRLKKPDFSHET